MRLVRTHRPADFVHVERSSEQLDALWSGIERAERVRFRRRRQLRAGALAASLGAAALALFLGFGDPPGEMVPAAPTALEQHVSDLAPSFALLPSAPAAGRVLALADGSTLELAPGAQAQLVAMGAEEVRVRLEWGAATCEVAPRPERRFVVEAGGFEVVVTGTRFSVSRGASPEGAPRVAVEVERGAVQVRDASGVVLATLQAGQLWASAARSSEGSEDLNAADAGALPALAPAESSSGEASPDAPPSRPPTPAAQVPPARPSPKRVRPRVTARELLTRASEARAAGKPGQAAAALARLLSRFPEDGSAGYAAFLLGRLRLDALNDPRGAAEAFAFAEAHPGSGFFAEDAAARLVEAWAAAGASEECRRARERFASRYPRSSHLARVASRCVAPALPHPQP